MNNLSIPTLFENADWQRCFECYLEQLQSHQTQTTYCSILCRFFRQFPNPDKVGSGDIEAFLSGTRRKSKNGTIAATTIDTRTSCLRSFYKFAGDYTISGKKRLFKSANPVDGIQHHNQPAQVPQSQKRLEALRTMPLPASNGNTSPEPRLTHIGSESIPPALDSIKKSLAAGQNVSLAVLLQAVNSLLPGEAQETVRQALAQRVNRGVSIGSPDTIDDIDPANLKNTALMHEHAGTLFEYGPGCCSFGGFTADKSHFVVVSQDLVQQHRRQILEVILNDYLGDKPALELAEDLAGNPLVIESGLFVFASNKVMPKPLSAINLRRMVDYFEQAETDEWYYPYWQIADERARQVAHWLPRDEEP